jgi:hypothetical protein
VLRRRRNRRADKRRPERAEVLISVRADGF